MRRLPLVLAAFLACVPAQAQNATLHAGTIMGVVAGFDPATASNVTLTNSNRTGTVTSGASGFVSVAQSSFKNTGKYYFEFTLTKTGVSGDNYGLVALAGTMAQVQASTATNSGLMAASGAITAQRIVTASTLGARSTGDIIGFAVDFTNWELWFRVAPSGNWNGNGAADPATNVGGISIAGYANTLMGPFISFNSGSFVSGPGSDTANFGSGAFSGSVPSGFTSGWPSLGGVATDGGFTFWDSGTMTNGVLDDGGLIAQHTNTTAGGVKALSTSFVNSGLLYFEETLKPGSNGDGNGIITAAGTYANAVAGTNGFYVYSSSGSVFSNGANSGKAIGAIAAGATVGYAVDFTHHTAWARLAPSGNWNGDVTANPATNTGGVSFSNFSATTLAPVSGFNNSASSISILNSGHTPFVGAVPSGFTSGWAK